MLTNIKNKFNNKLKENNCQINYCKIMRKVKNKKYNKNINKINK